MPLNASWPSHPDFWKSYGGKLTPKGIKEHTHIGAMLAARYTSLLRLIVRIPSTPVPASPIIA